MNLKTLLLAAALSPTPALAAQHVTVEPGDPANGARLFKLNCAQCHGENADGKGFLSASLTNPPPENLRDPAFLAEHSDNELHDAIVNGGKAVGGSFTMPAHGNSLDELEAWDLVAYLRHGRVSVADLFPEAAKFAAKTYTIDADGQKRLEEVIGKLNPGEEKVSVASVFSGEKPSQNGPVFVSQQPRDLDGLKPKMKAGYVAFSTVPVAGTNVDVAFGMNKDGVITSVVPDLSALKEKDRKKWEKAFAGFEGQGGKKSPERKDYKPLKPGKGAPKESAELAKALTRAYYRGLEGAIQFDKEERDRHWAD